MPTTPRAPFVYQAGSLYCEGVSLAVLAERYGTPLYVYSATAIRERYGLLRRAFGEEAQILYAVKANSNLTILQLFAGLGSGFDLVSGGELARIVAAGIDPQRAVLAGVAKEVWELEAAASAGIGAFHVETEYELDLLEELAARSDRVLDVALRINPDVDAATHPSIRTGTADSKFGLDFERAGECATRCARSKGLRLIGYHVHLGSQLRTAGPFEEAFDRVIEWMDRDAVRAETVSQYDMGGGFGIGPSLDVMALGASMQARARGRGLALALEPGRFLVGDAGVLLCKVLGRKDRPALRYALVDGAMNDLLRPALYDAVHPVWPVAEPVSDEGCVATTIAGPVCESGDVLAKDVLLPSTAISAGAMLALGEAGAYGASMASRYNSRRLPAEVLVDGESVTLIRRRENLSDQWQGELRLETDG